jgi:hypothetical protein
VPEIVASILKVAEIVTDLVPSALCDILPLVTLASLVVLPPLLLMAGEDQLELLPAIVVVLPDLPEILRDQPDACTRYIAQVIFDVLFATD